MRARSLFIPALIVCFACALPAAAGARTTDAHVRAAALALTKAKNGPPGVIITLHRNGKTKSIAVGRRDIKKAGAPRASDHMRIASITKMFTGVVALRLAQRGRIGLDTTIGTWLPALPTTWHAVTVRQLLNHTSGLPDYTKSAGFLNQFTTDPQGFVQPTTVVDWVRTEPLNFAPGSQYEYSNTDNIVYGLIAEVHSQSTFEKALSYFVFAPAKLSETSFPTESKLTKPFLHGYSPENDGAYSDVSSLLSPSGAWASGAIESTPNDLNKFIRAVMGAKLFNDRARQWQMRFIPNANSSPAGPGKNSAGLSLFKYETKCGTVYGHTGNFPGYVQFAAATRNGGRAITTSLNIAAPTGTLLKRLRAMQTTAVCALLDK
jgi:D-alanyl-D-alanine carboxypeptidase